MTSAHVFNTGDSTHRWVSPTKNYSTKESEDDYEYPDICHSFLGVKRIRGQTVLVNDTLGCSHGLNGTQNGSCDKLHDGCFYYLLEGRPIKTNRFGKKSKVKCKNGNKCRKSHDLCRDCCYATLTFIPIHSSTECPHHGFYNSLLKKNRFKEINYECKYDKTITEKKKKEVKIMINRHSRRASSREFEKEVHDQFERLMQMATSKGSKTTVEVGGEEFTFDVASSWS